MNFEFNGMLDSVLPNLYINRITLEQKNTQINNMNNHINNLHNKINHMGRYINYLRRMLSRRR